MFLHLFRHRVRAQVKRGHLLDKLFVSTPLFMTHFQLAEERTAEEPVDDGTRIAQLLEDARLISKGILKLCDVDFAIVARVCILLHSCLKVENVDVLQVEARCVSVNAHDKLMPDHLWLTEVLPAGAHYLRTNYI